MNKLFSLHVAVQACGCSTGEKEAGEEQVEASLGIRKVLAVLSMRTRIFMIDR